MRRIAVVTSGGDGPGMNPVIRAVVRAADQAGLATVGVRDGFAGLIDGAYTHLDARGVSGILHRPGSVLATARSPRFRSTEGRREALKHLDLAEVDGLVVIGGDGSMRGADALSREGTPSVVGVPATIHNDLAGGDFTIGFDTAVNTALESIDRIRDTATADERLSFVEVLGRHAGWVSLYCGVAGGATYVVTPDAGADVGAIRAALRRALGLGKRYCIVVVAEGEQAGGTYDIANRVCEDLEGIDPRVIVLGHAQRGAAPTMRDRFLGSVLGDAAVTALLDGEDRVMLGERCQSVVRTPLSRAWSEHHAPPEAFFDLLDRLAR